MRKLGDSVPRERTCTLGKVNLSDIFKLELGESGVTEQLKKKCQNCMGKKNCDESVIAARKDKNKNEQNWEKTFGLGD